jgi:hypothetical protein
VVDVSKTDTALCLNNVSLDNVILNDTDTFIYSVGLIDVTDIDIGLCLRSVGFPSVILIDTVTPISVLDGWIIHSTLVLHYSVSYGARHCYSTFPVPLTRCHTG